MNACSRVRVISEVIIKCLLKVTEDEVTTFYVMRCTGHPGAGAQHGERAERGARRPLGHHGDDFAGFFSEIDLIPPAHPSNAPKHARRRLVRLQRLPTAKIDCACNPGATYM